ncbi:MAG: glycine/sarcosine/betaine reductase selenoprotein B family protein [Acidimicrobiales bacterium]
MDRTPNSIDQPETLEAFKNSFFYGSRSNLDMKFLADLDASEAGRFFAEVLVELGRTIDDGDASRLIDLHRSWQQQAYGAHLDGKARFVYDDGPFTPLTKPLSDSRVALLTSSGHFVAGDDPRPFGVEDMTQAEAEARVSEFLRAEPSLSTIPCGTQRENLRVRHGGYPVRAVATDHNVALPLDALHQLAVDGVIGDLAANAYSFVGATSQLRLRDHVAPRWATQLRDEEVDAVLLVPV